jgi:hypothetical protein
MAPVSKSKVGTILVQVTEEHIARADNSAARSPFALAVRERLGKGPEVYISVCHQFVRIGDKFYKTPEDVVRREVEFTKNGTVEPFSTRLSNQVIKEA